MKKCVLLGILILAVVLTACSQPAPRTLTGTERDAVLAYSEAITDNLLAGMNAGDYDVFSRDFNQAMLDSISPADFVDMQVQIGGKIGAYVSREVQTVQQLEDMVTVTYTAEFEQDSPVIVRVVFEVAEPHQVTGLWFDSAKLRQP